MTFRDVTGNKDINAQLSKFLYKFSSNLTQMDFWNKLVEFQNDSNQSASSEASFLLACPPTATAFSASTGDANAAVKSFLELTFPIGGVQNFNPNEGKVFVPLKEIGSSRKRVVPGGTQYSMTISRLFTSHSNIKRAVYQWLFKMVDKNPSIFMVRAPGANGSKYFSGLESDIYKIPFGIIAVNCAANGDFIGADMLERCFIQSVSSGKVAQTPVIIDQMQCFVSRIIPLVDNSNKSLIGASVYPSTQLTEYKAYPLSTEPEPTAGGE